MFQFTDQIDFESIFVFDTLWIKNMHWAALPKASKAIFPVIMAHCNTKGLAFPSERRIAILSGRPDKSVRAGITELNGFPGFKIGYYITKRGKRAKRYHMKMPAIKRGETFPFRRCIIYGGNWSQLTPSATGLYPVMRYFGRFDFDRYVEEIDLDAELNEFNEIYQSRDFDFCEADPDIMAEFAGISRRSIKAALDNLEDKNLIEEISHGSWKVFLTPSMYFKRSFLNQQVIARYKHENKDGKKDR